MIYKQQKQICLYNTDNINIQGTNSVMLGTVT